MPSLVPIEEPYDDDLRSELLKHLQTRGYCVLLDVWERDSVSVYERRIRTLAGPGARFGVHANAIPEERRADTWWLPNDCPEFIEPIRAPRIRSMLPAALIPSPHPRSKIQCFEQAWVVDPKQEAQHWHKDYSHSGSLPSEKLDHYLYPENIYIASYYRDMTEADGPTQVIPGSHLDPTLVPDIDLKQHNVDWPTTTISPESFCCRKQDCIMWDQRLWHRRGPGGGGPEQPRILSIYGFMSIQTVGTPARIHPALARAWLEAESDEDKMFFGGRWSAESLFEEIETLRKERGAAQAALQAPKL